MKTAKSIWLYVVQLTILVIIASSASAQIKADFSATPVMGCPPMVVNFKDLSTGNPDTWKWDLGNGTISYLQNPIATYFNPGSYNIKLVAKSATGADSIVKSQYVVVNAPPTPVFGASDTAGCFPLKVQFTDTSLAGSGTITDWQWDFGDGTLSNLQNPEHTYTNSGNYTVILRVVNSNGCSGVATKASYIKIPSGVKADFSYTSTAGCRPPSPVTFTNKSVGTDSLKYLWDFGDGNTSALKDPLNNYQAAGSYTVKLIATNGFGCADTLEKPNAINIGFVNAKFTMPTTICEGSTFQITNTSDPSTYIGVKWDFGDSTTSTVNNPLKSYAAAGTYNIKFVADFGSCQDSMIKVVDVLPKPVAAFSAANNTACKTPLVVSFTNSSTDAVSYKWDFGDGSTATTKNPNHTYTIAGNHTVSLIIMNVSGCSDTLTIPDLVKIAPPKIASIKNLFVKGCLPYTVEPVAVIKDSIPIASYFWDFGDGYTSTSDSPSHQYTTPGSYTVKLKVVSVSGCTDTMSVIDAVKVGNKPVTAFSAVPLDACAYLPVTFKDESTSGPVQDWFWTFGDGGTSAEQNPIHAYLDTGYFPVTLVAYSFGCPDTLEKVDYVHISPPIAKFDTAYTCIDPLKRIFVNNSVGAETYAWDFGDGSTSSQKDVSHNYAIPGVYQVSLKVTNGACKHETKKDVVVVKEKGRLEVSDLASCINTRIIFNVANIEASKIATYAWYFNDLTQSAIVTANNPVATAYSTAGSRVASVVLTDILKCRDTLTVSVPVITYGPKAAFTSNLTNTCFGNTIKFQDATQTDGIHPVADWKWDFGEGGTQSYSAPPFKHDYSATGTYNVKLWVQDSYGCRDSITKPAFVSITQPVAKFTPSDTLICPAAAITFANSSQGVNANYLWTFGDGTTSTDISPVHKYGKTGTFPVKMVMIDKNGCSDSMMRQINVFTAVADFSLDNSFTTCPPLLVNATNKSTNFSSFNWSYDDGGNSTLPVSQKLYTYPGIYYIQLIVKNNGGCSDTLKKAITIQGPTGDFSYSPKEVCNPGKVNYQLTSENATRYTWDFNDGATTEATTTTTTHRYNEPGMFVPKVILWDDGGCAVPVVGKDTIKVDGIKTDILADTRVLCDSGFVAFKDSSSSNDAINGYSWTFGDGSVSTDKNPIHSYAKTGLYTITLVTKTQFGCTDSTAIDNCIKIVNSPAVRIAGDTSACEPAQLSFKGEFVRADTSAVTWSWSFGGTDSSYVQAPDVRSYLVAGTYPIKVKVTNSDGCFDMAKREAEIHPKPVIDAGADTIICRNSNFTLLATGADNYAWAVDKSLSCTNCASPVAKPDSLITYHVTGKTTFGCANEDSVTLNVLQHFAMAVQKGDTLCTGETISMKASGADAYQWTPTLWLDDASSAEPNSRPDSTITYQVVGNDSMGCFRDTGFVQVKVYPKPVIEITAGDNITVQVGNSVKLKTKSSGDITKWKWFPGQWLSCANCAEPVSAPKDNITYNVTASNDGNCTSTDKVTLNLICNNANVFVPNTFSPNGDGVNDVFYPRGSGLYNIRSFKIFNRWGQMVFNKEGFSANNPADGWNGTLNGVALQTDVYVYLLEVVCANNIVFPFKGNISLIR